MFSEKSWKCFDYWIRWKRTFWRSTFLRQKNNFCKSFVLNNNWFCNDCYWFTNFLVSFRLFGAQNYENGKLREVDVRNLWKKNLNSFMKAKGEWNSKKTSEEEEGNNLIVNISFDGNAEETRRLSLSQPGRRISGLLWWVEHFELFLFLRATTCQISIWAISQNFEMIYCVFDFFNNGIEMPTWIT